MDFGHGGTGANVTSRQRTGYTPSIELPFGAATQQLTTKSRDALEFHRDGISKEADTPREALAPPTSRTDYTRRRLKHAVRCADRMVVAHQENELMDLSLAGFDLLETFSDLWAIRADREPDWREILNIIDCTLRKREFEDLTEMQVNTVRSCVGTLCLPTVDQTDLEEVVISLQRAGLSPFGAISGEPSVGTQE